MKREQDIVEAVLASKHYHAVGRSTVERLVSAAMHRYGPKRAADETKRLLHQVWGLYLLASPRADSVARETAALLQLHQSTRERLPYLRQFYDRIFAVTGQPQHIVDYACGFNPLAFASLGYPFPSTYQAYDIDTETVAILNSWFTAHGLQHRYGAALGDLLIDPPQHADMALLLKVLPCLELQQKGSSVPVVVNQPARFVVVSYPLKSVSGKEKGMHALYREQFATLCSGRPWCVTDLSFAEELVYVIDTASNPA